MKVITLDAAGFTTTCRLLASRVVADGYMPGLLVGIKSGGEYVAEEMSASFPDALLAFVELRRPSSARKGRGVARFLSHLPLKVLDLLRMAESRMLSLRPRPLCPRIEISSELRRQLPARVLVVDDAIDSGITMQAVVEALRRARPDVEVRTAVITVTTSHPSVRADYTLYNNHTLIRFPWSIDAKK